jgi:uncharacterized repeat protein (TIGR01451 family)
VPIPLFAKAFVPANMDFLQTSVLTITIDNNAAEFPAEGLTFIDTLPAGVYVANPARRLLILPKVSFAK